MAMAAHQDTLKAFQTLFCIDIVVHKPKCVATIPKLRTLCLKKNKETSVEMYLENNAAMLFIDIYIICHL
jgi:hypothetical protein